MGSYKLRTGKTGILQQALGLRAASKISKEKGGTENDLPATDHAPIKKKKEKDQTERREELDCIDALPLFCWESSMHSSKLSPSPGNLDSGLQKLSKRRRSAAVLRLLGWKCICRSRHRNVREGVPLA